MTDWLREWIYGLTGAAAFCAVMTELTPKGAVKGVLRVACGMLLASALLGPLLRFDDAAYALNLARARAGAAEVTERAEEIASELDRRVIEERLRTYILDKARETGCVLADARVAVKWSGEGFWYPVSAELDGTYHQGLSDVLAAELGLGRGAQSWKDGAYGGSG